MVVGRVEDVLKGSGDVSNGSRCQRKVEIVEETEELEMGVISGLLDLQCCDSVANALPRLVCVLDCITGAYPGSWMKGTARGDNKTLLTFCWLGRLGGVGK